MGLRAATRRIRKGLIPLLQLLLVPGPEGEAGFPAAGSRALLQGIFPTQGSNLGPLHCRQILYCLSHQGPWGESVKHAGDALSAPFLCPPLGTAVDSRSCNSRVSNSLIFEALPLYTHLGFTFSCWLNLVSDHTSCSPTSAPYTRGRRSPSSFPLNCSSVSLYLERLS